MADDRAVIVAPARLSQVHAYQISTRPLQVARSCAYRRRRREHSFARDEGRCFAVPARLPTSSGGSDRTNPLRHRGGDRCWPGSRPDRHAWRSSGRHQPSAKPKTALTSHDALEAPTPGRAEVAPHCSRRRGPVMVGGQPAHRGGFSPRRRERSFGCGAWRCADGQARPARPRGGRGDGFDGRPAREVVALACDVAALDLRVGLPVAGRDARPGATLASRGAACGIAHLGDEDRGEDRSDALDRLDGLVALVAFRASVMVPSAILISRS